MISDRKCSGHMFYNNTEFEILNCFLTYYMDFSYRMRQFLSSSNHKSFGVTAFMSSRIKVRKWEILGLSCCHVSVVKNVSRCIMNDESCTYHHSLYETVGCTSSQWRRNSHLMLFIYKAQLLKLPSYLTSLFSRQSANSSRSSIYLTFHILFVCTDAGFRYDKPFK